MTYINESKADCPAAKIATLSMDDHAGVDITQTVELNDHESVIK